VIDLAAWRATWTELGAAQPDDALHQQLIACWSEPHRRYHTLQHLMEIMVQFDGARELARRPAEIELALWFHDAFYDAQRDDNEERSAQWARDTVRKAGLAEDVAQRLYALVMATRHEEIPTDADAQLLVDVDLSILGAETARFEQSNAQVREEYAHVPEKEYRQGRRRVLRSFLDRPRLYNTDKFYAQLEQRARENLQRELDRLQG
jgi:predicted metal-dependent HD superfamily phosphohydrolase